MSQELMEPSRQQLDDLEALIQQMLELPVKRAPEETLEETPAPPLTAPQAERLEPATGQPLAMALSGLEQAFQNEESLVPGPWPPVKSSPDQGLETRNQGPATRDQGPLVQPLLWIDRVFVAGTNRLGGVGRWLQAGSGRLLLGMMGLALLGSAIAWGILDWIGWSP